MPHEVEELAAFLMRLARTRQDSPALADEFGTAHYVRMPQRLLVSKGEAAERLGISVRTVERLVATGQLPQVYIERLARFRVSDLEAYVNGLAEKATAESEDAIARDCVGPGDAFTTAGAVRVEVSPHDDVGLRSVVCCSATTPASSPAHCRTWVTMSG